MWHENWSTAGLPYRRCPLLLLLLLRIFLLKVDCHVFFIFSRKSALAKSALFLLFLSGTGFSFRWFFLAFHFIISFLFS